MNEASNLSISTPQKMIWLLIGLVFGILVNHITWLLPDNDEASTCSVTTMDRGYGCEPVSYVSLIDNPCLIAIPGSDCDRPRPMIYLPNVPPPEAYPGAADEVNSGTIPNPWPNPK
jgi:hypothetical protein